LCNQVFQVTSVIADNPDVLARYRGQVIADVKEVANLVNEPNIALPRLIWRLTLPLRFTIASTGRIHDRVHATSRDGHDC
jgi:hypothetical protein